VKSNGNVENRFVEKHVEIVPASLDNKMANRTPGFLKCIQELEIRITFVNMHSVPDKTHH
jgi:hypothetical protein